MLCLPPTTQRFAPAYASCWRPPDIEVVGEAEDGQVAVELAEALRPDLVMMDIHMPRLSGIAATRQIAAT
ncbi:MAG: hypothetical protein OHK0015_15030 [Chloroflexi bacterium OHK40]